LYQIPSSRCPLVLPWADKACNYDDEERIAEAFKFGILREIVPTLVEQFTTAIKPLSGTPAVIASVDVIQAMVGEISLLAQNPKPRRKEGANLRSGH
jgi:hypothetical protein